MKTKIVTKVIKVAVFRDRYVYEFYCPDCKQRLDLPEFCDSVTCRCGLVWKVKVSIIAEGKGE